MKIVHISSEVAPFSKTGGLADVARSLPKAVRRLGHNVIVITPLYSQIINKKEHGLKPVFQNIKIYLNSKDALRVSYWRGWAMDGLPVYFIECRKYFSKRKSLYGSSHENARWLSFDVAALKLISLLKFEADIVHCHDWQTGLIPYYLKTDFRYSRTLRKAKTIFTIHNLVFQMGKNWWQVPLEKKDFGRTRLPHLDDPDLEYVNFVKRAILSADTISTVSEQYRQEIMTKNFGQDLHRILKNRSHRLYGIINGIDYKDYSPQNDPVLAKNYTHREIHRKKLNKIYLQKKLGLRRDYDLPVFCFTSRVAYQKGIELVLGLVDSLMKLDIQIVFMGDGDKNYISALKKAQKKYPEKIAWLSFSKNKKLENLMYAGADFFLLPSHHEPCGINQLIAMRYGCIPIVRKIGGLSDTVKNYNARTQKGTGFQFEKFNSEELYAIIQKALAVFRRKKTFRNIMVQAMKESNSWKIQAEKYVELYKKILRKN